MKKTLSLVLAFLLIWPLAVPAFASGTATSEPQYTADAEKLYELGLFKGSGNDADGNPNFKLSSKCTRLEALVILIRLLGLEDEALATTAENPFTDMQNSWGKKYVAYAYSIGLTNGIGNNRFGTGRSTPTQFATFILRALGYSDAKGGDFKFSEAIDKARELDLIPETMFTDDSDTLLRDACVNICFNALTTNLKDSDQTLAEKLVEEGTIQKEVAQKVGVLANDSDKDEATSAIQPMSVVRSLSTMKAVDGVEAYSEHWHSFNTKISADLSSALGLAYSLTYSDATTFGKLPEGYDPVSLLEWGKDPGLNVDILHKYGFTGKGAVIAYVDLPIGNHELYSKIDLHYVNNSGKNTEMHGPAVLSLLAGEGIGTAPEAEIYFYAHAAWKADQTTHAECLYQIIEKNKTLPESEKITMVGFSDNIDPGEKNQKALEDAVAACEAAGIMVWFCGENGSVSFLPMSDKNDYRNLVIEYWGGGLPSLVYIPASGRTTATNMAGADYIYWASSGLSWTMPYTLGLYAIVTEIDPTLTQDDLREMIVETAYINDAGIRIVNPVGFVAAALKGVGRNAEAQALLNEVAARSKYLYAVMDTAAMSKEDLTAVGDYLATITDATVLVVDASSFSNAQDLYTAMKEDAQSRNGTVVGVQIFGTPQMVPAFEVTYRVQMSTGVDDGGTFLTDLFYGNFDNEPDEIGKNYNVLDHFAEGWDVELIPDWTVARLPLSKGEFSAFFEKYEDFVLDTGLERQDLVNFSNPIFNSQNHPDDMSTFLNRMRNEFGLLDVDYRLYGNLDGNAPVKTKVLGNFTADNIAKENDAGVMELLINTHGQWNNIDRCIFENGKEIRISLMNMDTINSVLDGNYYYLDCWTCLNGYEMSNNLTTTALNGQCVGMFSATTIISNNGVNCRASVSQMKQSNFYYFYYCYLKALNEGQSRSQAFCSAQQLYGQALIDDSANGIRSGEGNYQFNLYNLFAYHNFGVIEPNAAVACLDAKGYIAQAGQSVPKQPTGVQGGGSQQSFSVLQLTDGEPIEKPRTLEYILDKSDIKSGTPKIYGCTIRNLDNEHIRIQIEYSVPINMNVSIFSPPNGDVFMILTKSSGTEKQTLTFDLSLDNISKSKDGLTVKFYSEEGGFFVYFLPEKLK